MEIRRAIGLVKDKTSIKLAKAARNADGHLEALIVKATSHNAGAAPGEKHLEEIVTVTWSSKPRAYSCVNSISKRLQKTRDWAVALKSLILVHKLATEGGDAIREEIAYASSGRFSGFLDLLGFKDESYPESLDYSEFVRSYGDYLGQKVRSMNTDEEDSKRDFGKVKRLQGLLDRVLRCRPVGVARSNKIVIAALHLVVVDSFEVYGDLCESLSLILDEFPDLGFERSAFAFELYVKAAKQIDALYEYYGACRDVGVGNSVGYPEVKKISNDLIKSLEEFLKVKLEVSTEAETTSRSGVKEEEESIWMLPPPLPAMDEIVTGDLIDFIQ
ncbi:uncharacterized protein [Phyllobates terribilis]|uniref:uncharacterized protein n=1 Tax=Phyllobates terribilis TaxID=111132 RepID=UPI003CCAE802